MKDQYNTLIRLIRKKQQIKEDAREDELAKTGAAIREILKEANILARELEEANVKLQLVLRKYPKDQEEIRVDRR